ncbi:hypothetical protein [Pseudonocardia asaccharolytica]|uniref:Anti-sigma-M factor RsmA n=1 Tax=Pseudonocardia asaccharolytica DSM 44247 = NBRC 16224 TaxID=1123024 RepID=A0A511D3P2_9PSEU|nr:hypothetical protein [Pseudonocardia asaccharolytica]GEL19400.1 hypothetical protein PA7_32370 [Pseudonocardia asaccharolytica DSM 44247 = NBRC 16224]
MTGSPDPVRLAELDAGLLDQEEAAAERARAAADPNAAAVLDALAATRAELAALPRPTLPPPVRARLRVALDAAAARRTSATRRRLLDTRRRLLATAATLVGLAATTAGIVGPGPVAGPRPALALHAAELPSVAAGAIGTTDLGPLTDAARRAACLRTAGVPGPHEPVLGGRPVVLDERPGTLLVLPTGALGSFRVLVVDRGCGPAGGTVLAERTVSR